MATRSFPRAPVTLILKDKATGREVAIPTDEVWMTVENHLSDRFARNLMREPEILAQTVTIEADFWRMQERMNTPQEAIEGRKEIEG